MSTVNGSNNSSNDVARPELSAYEKWSAQIQEAVDKGIENRRKRPVLYIDILRILAGSKGPTDDVMEVMNAMGFRAGYEVLKMFKPQTADEYRKLSLLLENLAHAVSSTPDLNSMSKKEEVRSLYLLLAAEQLTVRKGNVPYRQYSLALEAKLIGDKFSLDGFYMDNGVSPYLSTNSDFIRDMAVLMMAETDLSQVDLETAIEVLGRQAREKSPIVARLRHYLADKLVGLNRNEEAIKLLKPLWEDDFSYPEDREFGERLLSELLAKARNPKPIAQ